MVDVARAEDWRDRLVEMIRALPVDCQYNVTCTFDREPFTLRLLDGSVEDLGGANVAVEMSFRYTRQPEPVKKAPRKRRRETRSA